MIKKAWAVWKGGIKDGGGTVKVNNLTVGTSGQDINLNSTWITSGQTVTMTAFTITHAT